jgi:hypothetical protein
MPPWFRRRATKKELRRSPRPAALEERIEEIMDRAHKADDNQVERVAALEEYLTLARAHEGETWFEPQPWSGRPRGLSWRCARCPGVGP